MKQYILTLIQLLQFNILHNEVLISTNKLASLLGMSQQNISRHLIILEKEGYIKREIKSKGQIIYLTQKGKKILEEIFLILKRAFEGGGEIIIKGRVFTGIGEGGYYVTRKYYMEQFIKKLGFKPYAGTLNIKLIEPKDRYIIESYPYILIPGIRTRYRYYGWVKCFPGIINDKYECCVITLERTHYGPDVVEVLSPYYLRKELNLKDNDIVEIKLKPLNLTIENKNE